MNTFFKALNDATRREILDMLQDKDLSAGEIAEAFDISRPSISHHLEILKQAGLVDTERKGQFIYYSLNTTGLEDVTQWLFKLMNDK
ncbi:MAG: transcriptional regulator [Balneola sp.]|jgi:DNA-binding transcriptional ArsR family regulator|nr:transcriptional regulator [Balneola sp.]MBE79039.1 transcriptional regulator [Balneola sp.]|tara:strand:+ start:188 stop:448 length:261 start_codon:yes stop_codon:yes gene_type:complete